MYTNVDIKEGTFHDSPFGYRSFHVIRNFFFILCVHSIRSDGIFALNMLRAYKMEIKINVALVLNPIILSQFTLMH